ncbi:hypothetical protein SAMN05216412_10674 [Nitrosospira multiformis]|uniref:Uncharacterized protein n=1 Tax=Nitrosospira multiformis TaxID=1231 RepID=A0A1I0EBC7_9PROT|nr:hypothetical protein SAMN05216412_10674 [Nitrosospira multiformis]
METAHAFSCCELSAVQKAYYILKYTEADDRSLTRCQEHEHRERLEKWKSFLPWKVDYSGIRPKLGS